jgi:hypothetical protein
MAAADNNADGAPFIHKFVKYCEAAADGISKKDENDPGGVMLKLIQTILIAKGKLR